jgi:hypothetical protein
LTNELTNDTGFCVPMAAAAALQIVWMVVAVHIPQRFLGHSKKPSRVPCTDPNLHQPGCRSETYGMHTDLAV